MAASTAAIMGWYGPLIDLSKVSSYIDDFVQLLVFVHSSHPQPLRHKHSKSNASNGQAVLKTNILVSDDTRSYFSVSIWQKHMGSMIVAGDIILLQNVKIIKYRDMLEAATNQFSSLLVLVHPYELGASKDIDELVAVGQLRESAKGKLTRVVNWVQHTESALQLVQKVNSCQQRKRKAIRNWKACEEKNSRDCLSISEALRLVNRSHANFHAFIGEIFMPFIQRPDEFEAERVLFRKRLFTKVKNNIVEDIISKGCKLCGSPMVSSTSEPEQIKLPLYCTKVSNYHHNICMIYKPFLLYVWDQGGQIPLLVKNKAAEILFGNITAENVYKCYKEVENQRTGRGYERKQQHHCSANPNFYDIWLILAKALLQHEKNSPFGFEIAVDKEKDIENGRFELVSFTMPCYESGKS